MGEEEIRAKIAILIEEHRDMDAAIAALSGQSVYDQLQVQRLKKRKLQLRDHIQWLEDQLVPDIIA
jgi:hypothetical protein